MHRVSSYGSLRPLPRGPRPGNGSERIPVVHHLPGDGIHLRAGSAHRVPVGSDVPAGDGVRCQGPSGGGHPHVAQDRHLRGNRFLHRPHRPLQHQDHSARCRQRPGPRRFHRPRSAPRGALHHPHHLSLVQEEMVCHHPRHNHHLGHRCDPPPGGIHFQC